MGRSQFEELLRQDERNASLFVQEEKESDTPELPELTTELETIYPAEQNELPYDIVVERLRVTRRNVRSQSLLLQTSALPMNTWVKAGRSRNSAPTSWQSSF